jgi:crossover junction endodeoxyribonuclease RusA
MRFELELFPPTVNTVYRAFKNRMILSARGRKFFRDGKQMLMFDDPPITGRVAVSISLYPPDKRKRDIDNYVKSILDLMTKAGVWADDSQVDVIHVERRDIVPKGKFKIEIYELCQQQEKT